MDPLVGLETLMRRDFVDLKTKQVFDVYEIRARLCVVIFLVSPILLSLYLQVEAIRNLASTAVLAIALIALSNLLIVLVRARGKEVYDKSDILVQFLLPADTNVDRGVKKRLYEVLSSVDSSFAILNEEKYQELKTLDLNEKESQQYADYYHACKSALNWLKEKSRGSNIVSKDNATYGFCRNLYGAKPAGILICVSMFAIQIGQFYFQFGQMIANVSAEYMISVFATFVYLLMWIFCVSIKIVEISAKSYAISLIQSFDGFADKGGKGRE